MPALSEPTRRVLSLRPLVALSRARLRKVGSARVGRVVAIVIAVVAVGLVASLRVTDGAAAPVEGFVVGAARWSAWLAAGMVALGAAHRRGATDRREGLEVLGFARGYPSRGVDAARALAVSIEAGRAVLLPALVAGVAAIAASSSGRMAGTRLLLLVVVAVFAVTSGVALGSLATLADRLRPSGGRGLFLAVVILPWALFDLMGHPSYSVPGALDAVLGLGLDAVGLGGFS